MLGVARALTSSVLAAPLWVGLAPCDGSAAQQFQYQQEAFMVHQASALVVIATGEAEDAYALQMPLALTAHPDAYRAQWERDAPFPSMLHAFRHSGHRCLSLDGPCPSSLAALAAATLVTAGCSGGSSNASWVSIPDPVSQQPGSIVSACPPPVFASGATEQEKHQLCVTVRGSWASAAQRPAPRRNSSAAEHRAAAQRAAAVALAGSDPAASSALLPSALRALLAQLSERLWSDVAALDAVLRAAVGVERAAWVGAVFSGESFRLAATLCSVLVATHSATVAYICWRDLTGQWDRFAINERRAPTLALYLRGWIKFVFDISCFLLPAMSLVSYYRYADVEYARAHDAWWYGFLKQFVGYSTGELWVAGVHKLMHHPLVYDAVHKKHHCQVRELVASGAWLDTTWEFLFAEIPALCMALFLLPTNPRWHCAFFAYQGFGAACDHAGFVFNDANGGDWLHQNFFDGEFHYLHHLNPKVNFAEEEWIDFLFGTHHTYSAWWQRRERRAGAAEELGRDAAGEGSVGDGPMVRKPGAYEPVTMKRRILDALFSGIGE
jgi:sterol desaturase/sphingolipid hydroxylase (fatty acid hydroxylase superfamily)